MEKKSQSAIEYLLIVALALGFIVPTAYIFFKYTAKSNDEIIDSQITQIGNTIIDTAETVFFSGQGAKIILELKVPKNIIDAGIKSNRELIFKVLSEAGERELVFFSPTNILILSDDTSSACTSSGNCDFSDLANEGLKKIKVEAFFDETAQKTKVMVMEVN
ncbi:MAG: hypothetical protein AABX34_02805 [Nanoarchaeota archaeon]